MVLNIIEKYENINLQNRNINLKIKSDFYINDEAIELALAAGIISSFYDIALPPDLIVCGRLELTGAVISDRMLMEKVCAMTAKNITPVILSGGEPELSPESLKNIKLINIKSIDQLKNILINITKK